MAKTTVVVLFGGRSSEHGISSVTAGGILRAIDRDRYDVIPVGITRAGAFVLEDDDPDKFQLGADTLPEVIDNGTRVMWPEPQGERELRMRTADGKVSSLGLVDVVFPILHGPHGEDGEIQGFFQTIDLPYAGGGVLDSAIAMDKHFMKVVLQAAGISVAPWVTVSHSEWQSDREQVISASSELGLPAFVKPARSGSSVGVSKVADPSQWHAAFELAFAEDSRVLVEAQVVGREIEVAVLESSEGVRASLPGEIVLKGREFYDFEGKYQGGDGVEVVCPADLDASQIAAAQDLALRAFNVVGGRGLARVDMFLAGDGLYINELNTMPGFTPISMYPKCWVASGLTYPELLTEIIEAGLRRSSLAS